MKLTLGVAAALISCAAATAQPAADVYVLHSGASSSPISPSVPRSLARLILLQRLAPLDLGPSLDDIPPGTDTESVVDLMNQFGKMQPPLFQNEQSEEPSQLVLMLEGLTQAQLENTRELLDMQPSFQISDPPSASAHRKLIQNDFYNAGVTKEHDCNLEQVTNPFEKKCWSGKATVAKYDVGKNPEVLAAFLKKFSSLASLASSGEMESAVVLLPHVEEAAKSKQWSDKTQELRRRQAEAVISSFDETESTTSAAPTSTSFPPVKGPIPACFSSLDSCITGTGNCSHQGQCIDKYSSSKLQNAEACFSCHCMSTRNDKTGGVTHWAGPTCAKQDVSVPFWLFFGFTIVLVFVISMAVSTLYSVGEERLPGVIGAGVSRTK